MFPNLPEDLERTILRKYFIVFIVPSLNSDSIKRKNEFREKVLPLIINEAIMDKAARIVNSLLTDSGLSDEYVLTHPDNIDQLDKMFYSFVNVHKSGNLDIFNF